MTVSVNRNDRLELEFAPKPWAFARERRNDIDALFAEMRRARPALWNGRVLVLHHYTQADGLFRGAYLETDYASFRAWHRWGCPSAPAYDCFGAAAILSADNAFILGIMGEQTANAGRAYFPCGTPDPSDIVRDRVDLELSLRRELKEETGIDAVELAAEPAWTTVIADPFIAHIKVLRARDTAATLRDRIRGYLAHDPAPELAGIAVIRNLSDLTPAMPDFMTAFLKYRWARAE